MIKLSCLLEKFLVANMVVKMAPYINVHKTNMIKQQQQKAKLAFYPTIQCRNAAVTRINRKCLEASGQVRWSSLLLGRNVR